MHRPQERLHLPVLHPPDPRHRDRFGLRPSAQNDRRVRSAPTHSGRPEDHYGIRGRKRDAMTGRTRRPPPRLPSLRPEPIDFQRIGTEGDTRPSGLQYRAIPSDGQRRGYVTNGALGFDPVHHAGGPRDPECDEDGRDRDDDDELEESEPLGHSLFISCPRNPAATRKPSEKPENSPFAG